MTFPISDPSHLARVNVSYTDVVANVTFMPPLLLTPAVLTAYAPDHTCTVCVSGLWCLEAVGDFVLLCDVAVVGSTRL